MIRQRLGLIAGSAWWRRYPKAWLRPDIIAGLTAVVVIPKTMVCVTIAGRPHGHSSSHHSMESRP